MLFVDKQYLNNHSTVYLRDQQGLSVRLPGAIVVSASHLGSKLRCLTALFPGCGLAIAKCSRPDSCLRLDHQTQQNAVSHFD